MKLILRWVLNAVALMLIPELVSSVKVDSYTAALISAVLASKAATAIARSENERGENEGVGFMTSPLLPS